ncbi:unnamed protein product, partial [Oppiella nova]
KGKKGKGKDSKEKDEDGEGGGDGDGGGGGKKGKGGKGKGKKKGDGDGDGEGEGGGGDEDGGGGGGKSKGKGKKKKNKKGGKDSNEVGLPKYAAAGGAIGGIVGTGSQTIKKGAMSGIARALDDRFATMDLLGNPHMGVPEDMIGHIRMCAQFIYGGIHNLFFLLIRYPLKILSKAILLTGALSFMATYANWCANPIAWMDFTSEGKKVNAHIENLAKFKEEFKGRVIWTIDKARQEDKQMYLCCALQDYKKKVFAEVPESLDYLQSYMTRLYKLC